MPITADVSAPRAPSTMQVTNVQSIIGPYARCRIILLYRITAPTADLSALAGCSAIPFNLLITIA